MASIEKRGNSYRFTAYGGYDVNGKQIRYTKTWTPLPKMTPKQLEKELERQKFIFDEECKSGAYIDKNIKFAAFSAIWLEDCKEKLSPQTHELYKTMLKRINIAFGNMQLSTIQPHHLNKFYANLKEPDIKDSLYRITFDFNKWLKDNKITKVSIYKNKDNNICDTTLRNIAAYKAVTRQTAHKLCDILQIDFHTAFNPVTDVDTHLSASTIKSYHRVLSSIFQAAVYSRYLNINPCSLIKPPKTTETKHRYLDEAGVKRLIEALNNTDTMHRVIVTAALYTGLRRGELLGLEWKDVDFKNSTITVQRTSKYNPSDGVYTGEPKTAASIRTISIDKNLLNLLRYYQKEQYTNALALGSVWEWSDRLFTSYNGKPYPPTSLTNWFGKFCRDNGLDISFHSLRHTNATFLINSGVNITATSKRLGHSNTSVTGRIYAHELQTADREAAERLGDKFYSIING